MNSEGKSNECFGSHRFFVCETFVDEKTRVVDVVLACTACGISKVLQVSLISKKET